MNRYNAVCACGHAKSDHNPLTGRCYGDVAQCSCQRFEAREAAEAAGTRELPDAAEPPRAHDERRGQRRKQKKQPPAEPSP